MVRVCKFASVSHQCTIQVATQETQHVNSNLRQEVLLQGESQGGAKPDTVVFSIRTESHPRFTREGDNLRTLVTVPLVQALTGGCLEVQTLNGRFKPSPASLFNCTSVSTS